MKIKRIPLSSPDITDREREAVLDVLNSRYLSLGPKLSEFERRFSEYTGRKYAAAVNSGTSGLHLCVKALDIGRGDGVLTSPFSFIASANCILYEGAQPIFVDIDATTLNIDIDRLEEAVRNPEQISSQIKAILPIHVFGRPCEITDVMNIARIYDLKVIEDAAEAIGAEYRCMSQKTEDTIGDERAETGVPHTPCNKDLGNQDSNNSDWRKAGAFGDCAVFAFYPNKQITTGEGGMIVTDDRDLHEAFVSLRNQGRSNQGQWLQHERLGFNYRLSDINCALGIAQLERIDEILAKRERAANLYQKKQKEISELILPADEENKKISWFVYVVRLTEDFCRQDRDEILNHLRHDGIECSNYFTPIHLQPYYRDKFGFKEGDFPVTESVSARTIALPFFNNLEETQVDYIFKSLKKIIHSIKKKNRIFTPKSDLD